MREVKSKIAPGVPSLQVRDTGVGVPPERQVAIFESFTQGDDLPTSIHGGAGLGLAISRQLVELMGGRIGMVSEPGKGSTFWIEIPFPIEPGSDADCHHPAAASPAA